MNKTKRKFAENCVRNQIALIVNKTQSNILDKIDTHSLEGYCNYRISNIPILTLTLNYVPLIIVMFAKTDVILS